MRVLVVHNKYQTSNTSGENVSVEAEIDALKQHEIAVASLIATSDAIELRGIGSRISAGMNAVWSRHSAKRIRQVLNDFEPDIVHLHNVFPLLSTSVGFEARKVGIPVVLSVRNYRLECANGLFLREGKICTDCSGSVYGLPGVIHGCYRSSRAATTIMSAHQVLLRQLVKDLDLLLPLSDFVKRYLSDYGIAPERLVVQPNIVNDPGPPTPPGTSYLYAGRISQEKGIHLLLEAWERSGLASEARDLIIVGDGPDSQLLRNLPNGATWRGSADSNTMSSLYRSAGVVVVPSLAQETFGRTAAEAMAHARPAIVTNRGALPERVSRHSGWLAEPTVDSLAEALRDSSRANLHEYGHQARNEYRHALSPHLVVERLIDSYQVAIRFNARRNSPSL